MALALCNATIDAQRREISAHGTPLFPAACYHDNLAVETVPWHWHEELEALVVTEGCAHVLAGAEKWTVRAGEGVFVNAGVLHAVRDAEATACRLHSVVFHPRLVGGGLDSVFWQKYLTPLMKDASRDSVRFDATTEWGRALNAAVEAAWQACASELPGYEFTARAALSEMVFLLSEHRPGERSRPSEKTLRDAERIKTMLQYVAEHYSGELTTAQIARSAMISSSECLRCFHNTIGATPMQYVKLFRVQTAAALLTTTGRRIADIGAQCGFQEMSYFSKAFRQAYGCTPSEYRGREAART